MPPRSSKQLTSYQIPVKIHKITVMLTVAPNDTLGQLKESVLSAIKQFQESDPNFEVNEVEKIPMLTSTDQFELYKRVKNGRKFTGEHTALGDEEQIRSVVTNWEAIILRVKDENGELRPIRVAFPPLLVDENEDEEMAPPSPIEEESSLKRKDPPE